MVLSSNEETCENNWSRALQEVPQLNYTMEYVTTYLQEIPQLNYTMEYVTTYLQEIPQRIK